MIIYVELYLLRLNQQTCIYLPALRLNKWIRYLPLWLNNVECITCIYSLPDTFGLQWHRVYNDRKAASSGRRDRVVMEKLEHSKSAIVLRLKTGSDLQ